MTPSDPLELAERLRKVADEQQAAAAPETVAAPAEKNRDDRLVIARRIIEDREEARRTVGWLRDTGFCADAEALARLVLEEA